ncbi:hypothetical protein HRE53_16520 [Acaryochloris sp. 'Moss Beach']|uniref:hypothetical protein n=1 Tax=Acaryochloris sp. 'Moss Beach' TaxID=2740837 RepID=UPI001F2EEA7C|nr:hypothetical protein [Acaryochloris sp. 'Moss Beach']UJB68185.1 hypothetical protein HRE53_16520 [Acaryochloris sp. 'Moss Beach']
MINLLMVSVVWQHRAIPVWCEALCKKGSSNYDEQTAVLSKVIRHLSAYRLVILGDREFCSVKLGQWLGQQKVYFCLRLKRNTEVALAQQFTQQLQQFGLVPGQKLFLNDVRVTQAKGFGTFNVAAKWKRRYQGFAPDEAWFILTNFCDLNSAIVSYQKTLLYRRNVSGLQARRLLSRRLSSHARTVGGYRYCDCHCLYQCGTARAKSQAKRTTALYY